MNIERLPSGSYRITQMFQGKRYRATVDFKPTTKEAIKILSDLMEKDEGPADGYSVGFYVDKYLNTIRAAGKLSPATIKGYGSISRSLSEDFKAKRLSNLTEEDIGRELKRYSDDHAAKSVKNMKGFIEVVLKEYRPKFIWNYVIPLKERKKEYEPTTEDVMRILEASKGSRFEVSLKLAVLGLRRGEIMALTPSDLSDDDMLSINKAMVLNENNDRVIKEPKTEASKRTIRLPHELAELIRERGFFDGNPHMINKYIHSLQDKLGIPSFKLHMLRHFAVAYMHKEGFTTEQILAFGGWSTDSVMKRAYRYNLDPKEAQEAISNRFSSLM